MEILMSDKKKPVSKLKLRASTRVPGAKPAEQSVAKRPAAKLPNTSKPAPASAKPAKAAPAINAKKVKKPKVVRDSFTMPKSEYEQIEALKKLCLSVGIAAKKSELLRAGLIALSTLSTAQLKTAIQALDNVKTGRPKMEANNSSKNPKPKSAVAKKR
jgi:hypothetical protein